MSKTVNAWKWTPAAVVKSADDQSADPTKAALRGPTFSTHEPNVEVVKPSTTAEAENTVTTTDWFQSPEEAVMTPIACVMPGVHME